EFRARRIVAEHLDARRLEVPVAGRYSRTWAAFPLRSVPAQRVRTDHCRYTVPHQTVGDGTCCPHGWFRSAARCRAGDQQQHLSAGLSRTIPRSRDARRPGSDRPCRVPAGLREGWNMKLRPSFAIVVTMVALAACQPPAAEWTENEAPKQI